MWRGWRWIKLLSQPPKRADSCKPITASYLFPPKLYYAARSRCFLEPVINANNFSLIMQEFLRCFMGQIEGFVREETIAFQTKKTEMVLNLNNPISLLCSFLCIVWAFWADQGPTYPAPRFPVIRNPKPIPVQCARDCTRALDWNGFRVANDRKSRSRIGWITRLRRVLRFDFFPEFSLDPCDHLPFWFGLVVYCKTHQRMLFHNFDNFHTQG